MLRREFLKGVPPTLLLFSLGLHTTSCVMGAETGTQSMTAPIYPAQNTNREDLEKLCAPFLALSVEELIALVPPQGGFLYSGCPNCSGGSGDDNITWNLSLGDKVQCQYCKVVLPNQQYPYNEQVEVETPTGGKQVFNLHVDAKGKKYWLEAKGWYMQRHILSNATYDLAQLYRLDPVQYAGAGQRATAIMARFAEVYPEYIVKFEYPSRDKIFMANEDRASGYRSKAGSGAGYAAKWSAWGYTDLPVPMLLAYDQLVGAALVTAAQRQLIEKDLFGGMLDFVGGHTSLVLNNMSPTLWRSQAIASNVLNRPDVTKNILPGIRELLRTDFFYDGFWNESTVSYHIQTAGGFQNVLEALYPGKNAGWDVDFLKQSHPEIYLAMNATKKFALPNQRYAAVNDTWGEDKRRVAKMEESSPHLLPAMGYGILGGGTGEQQWQTHLNWTGRFGHHHFGSLNLLMFAQGKELISDIGYTHTKARPWTTATASHNTVVIDQLNQERGEEPWNARGNLLLFNTDDAGFQAVEASAPQAYSKANDYRRLLANVQSGDVHYVVDVFNVSGGSAHDWLLHGSVDDNQILELATFDNVALPLQPVASLLPAGYEFEPPVAEKDTPKIHEGPWAYGHFQQVRQHQTPQNVKATFRYTDNPAQGLQSWVIGEVGTTYSTTRSWCSRWVKDQAKLDETLRSSLIVHRNKATNRFVAVHVPFTDQTAVRQVTSLPWANGGIALKIEHTHGTDYVLVQNEGVAHSGQLEGQTVHFNGRVALIQVRNNQAQLKIIGGTKLQYQDKTIESIVPVSRLVSVKDNVLTLEGDFKAKAGDVVILKHNQDNTSALHVKSIRNNGNRTEIETEEPPVFITQADGSLKMQFFPHAVLVGPHTVSTTPLASQ